VGAGVAGSARVEEVEVRIFGYKLKVCIRVGEVEGRVWGRGYSLEKTNRSHTHTRQNHTNRRVNPLLD